MNAKDLLQINEQICAFNAIMKGELEKEIDQANTAIEALGGAQAIAKAKASMEADKASLDAYKASVDQAIQERKDELAKEKADLDAKELSVSNAEKALATETAAFLEQGRAFQIQMTEEQTKLNLAKKGLQPALDDLANQQKNMQVARLDLEAREAALAAKLAALKAIH